MINTKRLEIIPLTCRQLDLWINDLEVLEKELNIKYKAEPVEGIFREILKEQLKITQNDELNYSWHSFWFIIRKSDRDVVGSIDFKDTPNKDGMVEIGYGLGEEFEHNGYMTETVKAICDWALNQKGVGNIIAETDVDGYASQRILKRCGFKKYKEGQTFWWRLKEK